MMGIRGDSKECEGTHDGRHSRWRGYGRVSKEGTLFQDIMRRKKVQRRGRKTGEYVRRQSCNRLRLSVIFYTTGLSRDWNYKKAD